jgi:hypothetical protein
MYLDYSVSGLPGLYQPPPNQRMKLTARVSPLFCDRLGRRSLCALR